MSLCTLQGILNFIENVSVWKINPVAVKSVEAKCVLPGEACTAPAQGDTFVDTRGVSWKGSVTNLFSDTSYDCFVITNRRIGRPQCSKPVSITTKLLPPYVYSSNNVTPNSSLPASYKTERCFVGKNGNLADCMDTSLTDELAIVVGVVDPQKRWITFANNNIQVTCPIGPMGTIDASECQTTYCLLYTSPSPRDQRGSG